MINNILRGTFYFVVFALIQIFVLNNIHFLRIATPFLYLYFILKLPVGTSRSLVVFFSFSNGTGDRSVCQYARYACCGLHPGGFLRAPLINVMMGNELPEGVYPSFKVFGYGGFFRFSLFITILHHVALFSIESLTFFDPLFMLLRIVASAALTVLVIFIVEAFNIESHRIDG
jgi:hypothetical protein